MKRPGSPREEVRFWQAEALGGLELLRAHYIQQRFSPHSHDAYAIAVIEAGAERYRYRGADHLAPAGSLALVNPDEVHTGSKGHEDGWRYRVFYPRTAQIRSLLAELDMPEARLPLFPDSVHLDPPLVARFAALHRLLESGASALQQQTAWRESMLLLFQRHARLPGPAPAGREPQAVTRARELLAASLEAPPSLEELAAAVGLSPFHLARVFRQATGLPPHAWLRQRRLEQARASLERGDAPLDVAHELGFSDQSHLSRQFKQAFGVTPGDYRSACARSFKHGTLSQP
jgi:AraC-like DNA-binding protein